MTNERFQIIKAKLEQIDKLKSKLDCLLHPESPFGVGGIGVTLNGIEVTALFSPEKIDELRSHSISATESHLTKLQKEFEKL